MSLYICNLFICIKTHIYNLLITFAFSKLFCFGSQRMILEGFICGQPQSCVGRWSALQVPGQVNVTIPAGCLGGEELWAWPSGSSLPSRLRVLLPDDSTLIYQQLVSRRRSELKMSNHRGLFTLVWEEVFLMSNVAGISPSWLKKTSFRAWAVKRTFWV